MEATQAAQARMQARRTKKKPDPCPSLPCSAEAERSPSISAVTAARSTTTRAGLPLIDKAVPFRWDSHDSSLAVEY